MEERVGGGVGGGGGGLFPAMVVAAKRWSADAEPGQSRSNQSASCIYDHERRHGQSVQVESVCKVHI